MAELIIDTNMLAAYVYASEIFQPASLPSSLSDDDKNTSVQRIAELVSEMNSPLVGGKSHTEYTMLEDLDVIQKQSRFAQLGEISKSYITENTSEESRLNILLRLWSGCIDAAKNIAFTTRSGDNIPLSREIAFKSRIDVLSKIDLVYCAGVEAAPSFKKLQRQQYSFAGVPLHSSVRRYPNEYLVI